MSTPIELRLLRQFVVLAEELNFRRAAARLHMSQPPLSVAMQKLEAELGVVLLDRSRHHVRLTAAGEAYREDAARVLQQLERAGERARRVAEGREGSLRLGFVPSAALDVVPALFERFRRDYPTVELELVAETTARQLRALREGRIDLALLVGPVTDARGLALVELATQGLAVVVPAAHPLAARRRVRLGELAAEPFVAFTAEESSGFATAWLGACRDAGFAPRVVQQASQMQAILALVAGGLGVAVVPAALRRLRMDGVALLAIAARGTPPGYPLVFAHPRETENPAVAAFVASARRALAPARGR
jgi:DNA-binding transcriptional LysR family regulator